MIFDSLLAVYGHLSNVVVRAGCVYPAAFEPSSRPASGLVAIASEPAPIDPELRRVGAAHLRAVAKRAPGMHDGAVLAFIDAHSLPLSCARGGYFDAIATSDSLRAELEGAPESVELAALPLRALAHRAAGGDPLHSGRGRAGAVGVSVAVTLPLGAGAAAPRTLVLGRRSNELATDPGRWHIAPSGTLEPSVRGDVVISLVGRELDEELGVHIRDQAELARRLRTLGVGFDLLRLRPEICLRLDLELDECPVGGPALSPQEFQDRALLELSPAGFERLWHAYPPDALTPAAAATIALLEQRGRGG